MIFGVISASPAATTLTAFSSSIGSVSFSRKPLAPARSASWTYSSRSNVVRMTTRVALSDSSPVIRRVASNPSMTGIRTSISITSGRSLAASATASAPLAAWPTTAMSGSPFSSMLNPLAHQGLVVGHHDSDRHSGSP